jgi:hypothetical protein
MPLNDPVKEMRARLPYQVSRVEIFFMNLLTRNIEHLQNDQQNFPACPFLGCLIGSIKLLRFDPYPFPGFPGCVTG